jgi:hypothetical protein
MRSRLLLASALISAAFAAGVLWSRLPLAGDDAKASTAPEDGLSEPPVRALSSIIFIADATSDLTLTTSLQSVPVLTVETPPGGGVLYEVEVCLLFQGEGTGDEDPSAAFAPRVRGPLEDRAGVTWLCSNQLQTTCHIWGITDTFFVSAIIEVVTHKDTGAAGTSKVVSGNGASRVIVTREE